jgi:multicomponent Na+:H+ antiporter subunit G
MIDATFDLIGALLMLVGAGLCFAAAVALVRFPDVMSKMHAVTKPQVLGLIAISLGIGLSLRTWWASGLCILIVVVQLLTAPVSANLVARGAYRAGLANDSQLKYNHLADDLKEAGYTRPEQL